jgi:DNA-binding XRE family transcriptional regulator
MVKPKVAQASETPKGRGAPSPANDEVTIPRVEWAALRERVEDLEDALVVERFRKEHGFGSDAFIPEAVANRLLDGEAPLRVWRTHRGLTQEALAKASGVSRALIADIETGRKRGSMESTFALADALKLKADDLFVP